MKLFLIRHTPIQVEDGICYGQKDFPLKDSYKEDFETVRKKLSTENIDAFYSSPIERCSSLAKHLADEKEILDDRLKELNFGDWDGKTWEDIKDPFLGKWMEDFINKKCSNGESFAILKLRVEEFLNEIKTKDYKNIAIITHVGVIRCIESIVKNEDLEKSFNETPLACGDIKIVDLV